MEFIKQFNSIIFEDPDRRTGYNVSQLEIIIKLIKN